MPGGETFMKIVSTSIDLQDLRTAYRWAEGGAVVCCRSGTLGAL